MSTKDRGAPRGRGATSLVAGCLAIGLLAACSAQSTSGPGSAGTAPSGNGTVVPVDEGTPKDGGKLAFGLDAEPDSLDTTSSQWAYNGHLIASSMIETLTAFDAEHVAKPYLAESVTPSDLAAKWTITVKPNITFHDGTPLDAAAVKANLDAQKKGIAGIGLTTLDSVSIKSDLVVEVTMTQPWASFPSILASSIGYVVSPASLGAADANTRPIGTGPFTMDRWDRGSVVAVKKNSKYWQRGKPHLDAIDFRIITDPTSRLNSLSTGDLDMILTDQPQNITDYRGKAGFKTIIDQSGDAESIFLNHASEPFDNADARKAVVLATDSASLAETLGGGVLKPIDQPFAKGSAYYQDDPRYQKYDLEAAKKAVQKYTAATGKPLEFTLVVFTGSTNLALAQILQEQWNKAGIKSSIKSQDQAEAIKDIIFGKTQSALAANFGYPDPDFYYAFWHSSYTAPVGTLAINFPHLKSDELDKALLEGRVNLVVDKRKAAYQQAVRLLNEDSAYIWLYRFVVALIAEDRVKGLHRAETTGFSTVSHKDWFGDLWLDRKQ